MKNLCKAFAVVVLIAACGQHPTEQKEVKKAKIPGSFASDLDFLMEKDSALIVLKKGESQVVVSPKYQAKVFTSTTGGGNGRSLGWINYKAFDGPQDPHMNAYGGENRFWLGPEGNAFSLFFEPGMEMDFDHWKTPPPIDTEGWEILADDSTRVTLQKEMSLINYSGTRLQIKAGRTIEILDRKQISALLGIDTGNTQSVGFKTTNSIENAGGFQWTKETGAPCIWMLDMFRPTDNTTVFIPYIENGDGPVATTDYFGEIPQERIAFAGNTLYLKADGKFRGKVGIHPKRAMTYAGSYDAANKVLTIASFDIEGKASYLNQEWNLESDPFEGDAVNAYNDGPLQDGSQMGPFYEIESVSPAAFLNPGEKMEHVHAVYHFIGETGDLNAICTKIFGIHITDITGIFDSD